MLTATISASFDSDAIRKAVDAAAAKIRQQLKKAGLARVSVTVKKKGGGYALSLNGPKDQLKKAEEILPRIQ